MTKVEGIQPHLLLASIKTSEFLIALGVLIPVFRLTKTLSQLLQKEDCDLSLCVKYADDLHKEIQEMRNNVNDLFGSIFKTASQVAEDMGFEIKVPRVAARQKNRDNYDGDSESYFRRSVRIPFSDHYLEELDARFLQHCDILSNIQYLLSTKISNLNTEQLKKIVESFESQWPNDITVTEDFEAEVAMWKRFVQENPLF